MARPLIGITTSLTDTDRPRQLLDCHYVDAVEMAGGCPVPVAMASHVDALAPLLSQLDGLVITGGPAICDGLVGDLPHDISRTPTRRHEADLLCFGMMQERHRPVLGICYGMQFINARHGGTINADLQAHFGAGPHSPSRHDGKDVFHEIHIEAGSHVAAALGAEQCVVNSYHIQSVVEVAPGLRCTAHSEDGIIEALETEDGMAVGVQFHPEKMGADGAGLFRQLVERAQ